jgi:signal transduction histidine kinase
VRSGWAMRETYFASLLVTGGVCLGFAMHAFMLAKQSRQRMYLWLSLLSLLEVAYCVSVYGALTELRPPMVVRWTRAVCFFTPFMTCIFAELVIELAGIGRRRPRWFHIYQRLALAGTSAYSLLGMLDALFGSAFVLTGAVSTDVASRHVYRVAFAPLGQTWLAWVSFNFGLFSVLLLRGFRTRHQLLPVAVGCVIYFAATLSDFGVVTGLYDWYYVQHLGFAALVIGFWSVLAGRYELSLLELSAVVGSLEEQRRRLDISPQLAHQNRLDGIGLLAAGVAHEINNPVHGIMNYAELLKKQTSDAQAIAFAEEISHECARVAGIVKALLSFSRSDDNHLGNVSVQEMVDDVLRLIRSSMTAAGIDLRVDIASDTPDVDRGAQRLKQVIMNLLTNATDALAERDPRRPGAKLVRIVASRYDRAGTDWLVIETIDNADGIEPALVDRIFDPFFTTKPPGRGTGLGLAVSQAIVAAQGGQLTCRSARGEGTTFRVAIPVMDASSPSLAAAQ